MTLLALAAVAALAASPVRFLDLGEPAIDAHLASVHAATPELPARIEAVSEAFLGTPYKLGPLGEGEGGEYDRDPLISFKLADCTTFVEEVMALSLEPELARAKDVLARIRYKDARVTYETRNHYPEVDWLPNNIRAGYLRDITRTVGGRRTKWVFKTISKRSWYLSKSTSDLEGFEFEPPEAKAARVERWRAAGADMKDQNARLAYVALEELPDLAAAIPSGSVANIVRESLGDKPVVVTHQGLVLQRPGGTVLRHAAFGRHVEDVPLLEYAARFKDAKWRVLGLNLSAVAKPAAD